MAKVIQGAPSLHSSTQRSTSEACEGSGLGSGSLNDFQSIYREHYPAIWRFLLHLGVRKSDVADVTHDAVTPHRKVTCFAPANTGTNQKVLMLQSGGSFGAGAAPVFDYFQCPFGYYRDSLQCVPCPDGLPSRSN